jgi:hypothetical protein
MPGRIALGLGLAVLLAGACGPEPRPAVTAPPEPAAAVPWPDLEWTEADLPEAQGVLVGESIRAVAADASGFVAVGTREIRGVSQGVIWFSDDGRSWQVVGVPAPVEDVNVVAVAAGAGGFVAVGSTAVNAELAAVLFRSDDGRRWERLALQGAPGGFVHSVAGGPLGYVVSADDGGQGVTWVSSDGRSWTHVAAGAMADGTAGVFDPQAVADGWVGLRSNAVPSPAFLSSSDGVSWTATVIEPTEEALPLRLVAGSWGYLVQGIPSCALGSCPDPVIWWSGDGTKWTRIAAEGPLKGGDTVAAAGDHGFIGVAGDSAWSSTTGWSWASLPAPVDDIGAGSVGVTDVVVRGDVIVAVGGRNLPDGRSGGWIAVAE